jgi:hypothetical protein
VREIAEEEAGSLIQTSLRTISTALLQKIRSVVHYDVFQGGSSMSDFKWRHFRGEIILSGVRWYCKYGISYRDLEEMMLERGLDGSHDALPLGSALRA